MAGVIEEATGELQVVRPPHRTCELVSWLAARGPAVTVAYEAGPTGSELARALSAGGHQPHRGGAEPHRPLALRAQRKERWRRRQDLGRLLRRGELVGVAVADARDEAGRDLGAPVRTPALRRGLPAAVRAASMPFGRDLGHERSAGLRHAPGLRG